MTTAPVRARRLAASPAVAAAAAAAAALLLCGAPAAAAPQPHKARHQHSAQPRPPHPRHARPGHASQGPPVRQVRFIRSLRRWAEPLPTRRRPAKRPAKHSLAWSLDIPSIRVDAKLMPLGGPTGGLGGPVTLPTPPLSKAASTVGWYDFTARPGDVGNAVIVGHVDTYVGPGVFYNLYELRPRTAVFVTVAGFRKRFEVTSASEMAKSNFPVNKVFGATGKHMLWLITCGGDFDYVTGHYLDNIVISATWVPPQRKQSIAVKK